MILTKTVKVKITIKNYDHYTNLGFNPTIGEYIDLPIELLSNGSHQKIHCKCDGCGKEKDILFRNLIMYKNDWGIYYCRQCAEKKRVSSLKEHYGVDNPLHSKEIVEKIKATKAKKRVERLEKRVEYQKKMMKE